MKKRSALGVRKKVIIHMPEQAVCLSRASCNYVGTLYGSWDDRKILEFANASAAMSLRSTGATGALAQRKRRWNFVPVSHSGRREQKSSFVKNRRCNLDEAERLVYQP